MHFEPDFKLPVNESAKAMWFVFHEGRLLIKAGDETRLIPRSTELAEFDISPIHKQYLGRLEGLPCYAAELTHNCIAADGFAFKGLRSLFGRLDEGMAALRALAGHALHHDGGLFVRPGQRDDQTHHHHDDQDAPRRQPVQQPRLHVQTREFRYDALEHRALFSTG